MKELWFIGGFNHNKILNSNDEMSKYSVIQLSPHKARINHICTKCKKVISKGDRIYYRKDRHLQSFNKEKVCKNCYLGKNKLNWVV